MEKLYESKFMKTLQHFGEKVAGNKVFSSISSGMMITMGVILVSAVFQIVASVATMMKWLTIDSSVYKFLMTPYNMTMGMISLLVAFGIAYTYAKALGMKPLVNGGNSLILFLLVAAPSQTLVLEGGKSTFTGLDAGTLGGVGLFTAIIIAIISVKITHFFEKHNVVIKMPQVVPQFLQDSFSSMVPLLANVLIWHGINTLVLALFKVTLPMAINTVLAMPLGALTSVPGMILCSLAVTLLWSFGIHGTMVVYIAIMPSMMQAVAHNGTLVAAGKPAEFVPVLLFTAVATCGGTGNTLPLVLMGLRSKSEQLKAISKASLVPSFFGINEPVEFGFPIMYNPIMIIPYILTPIITMLLVWFGYIIGFFKPAYVLLMTTLPIGVSEFLGSMAWQNLLMPILGCVVGFIFYRPFFKVYEKQLVAKESAAKEAELAEKTVNA